MQMHLTTKQATLEQDIHPCEDVPHQIIDVNTGEVKIASGPIMLRSVAIGSCIVVATLDSEKKVGAMAHIMLPGTAPSNSIDKTKYAADAIDELIGMLNDSEFEQGDIDVFLVGAGNVLRKEDDTICQANIKSVTGILKEKNIPVKASVLGGIKRKSIFMDIEDCCISFTEGNEKEKVLWKADFNELERLKK